MKGLGGATATKDAFEWFRAQAMEAGLPGLHLQMVYWGDMNFSFSGVDGGKMITSSEIVDLLGFDSMSHYQFCHFVDIDRDYNEIIIDVLKNWEYIDKTFSIPYFPHISIGWDNNPRFNELRPGITRNNTPEDVEKAFEKARKYVDAHPSQPPLITINSWNEWTETSYLQPDDLYGYGYLEAVKRVFGI